MRTLLASIVLVGLIVTGCVGVPPTVTTPAGHRAYTANQLIADLKALSVTAIALNGETGALHLNDQDTRYVRAFTLAAGDAAQRYAEGTGTLDVIITGLKTLRDQLSAESQINGRVQTALALIRIGLAALTGEPQ